jgi:hypothetical protein
MKFEARELAVGLLLRNQGGGCPGATGCQGYTPAPAPPRPDCGACTPATEQQTGDCEKEPRADQASPLGRLRFQLSEALSQPGAR